MYIHMGKTVTECFFKCHAEKFDFLPAESLFVMFNAYI